MTAPKARSHAGKYAVKIGGPKIYPSVSQICSQPDLAAAAAYETAKWFVNKDNWYYMSDGEALYTGSKAFQEKWTRLADQGTRTHSRIECFLNNESHDDIPVIEEFELNYLAAFHSFYMAEVASVVFYERSIIYDNGDYSFGGTPDCVLTLKDGRTALVDWKTGKIYLDKPPYQLAAYMNATGIGVYSEDGELVGIDPMPKIDVGLVVYLKPDSTYTAIEVPQEIDGHSVFEEGFLPKRLAYNVDRQIKTWERKIKKDLQSEMEISDAPVLDRLVLRTDLEKLDDDLKTEVYSRWVWGSLKHNAPNTITEADLERAAEMCNPFFETQNERWKERFDKLIELEESFEPFDGEVGDRNRIRHYEYTEILAWRDECVMRVVEGTFGKVERIK